MQWCKPSPGAPRPPPADIPGAEAPTAAEAASTEGVDPVEMAGAVATADSALASSEVPLSAAAAMPVVAEALNALAASNAEAAEAESPAARDAQAAPTEADYLGVSAEAWAALVVGLLSVASWVLSIKLQKYMLPDFVSSSGFEPSPPLGEAVGKAKTKCKLLV
mmetsp:Transcript_44082/g.118909  ORF Transcript_44082/g.118909 Transcript_44082/m.118909 type:complete len:164 (-) Transcript_44082:196-687(-)